MNCNSPMRASAESPVCMEEVKNLVAKALTSLNLDEPMVGDY